MLITFGQMMKNLKLDLAAARNLKWVQALGTGLDGITDQPALKPGVTVTSLHGVHGAPVSEAALASMLALSRDLPGFVRAQDEHQWKRWPAKLLQGKTVGILGIGVIAEALAPKCKALGMTVVGITSSPRKVAGFDRVHPVGELLQVLAERRSLRAADALLARHASDDRRQGVRGDEAHGLFHQSGARRRGGRGRADRGACAARKSPAPRSTCSTRSRCRRTIRCGRFKNVIITTHQGGFCDTYPDLAMPILEHNMRCFLNGDLKGMMNVARAAA